MLYQFNTSHFDDDHVFYLGFTKKIKYHDFSFYYRNAFQLTVNSFTGLKKYDRPIYQYRTRLRIQYKFNKDIDIALSAEPTIDLFGKHMIILSKTRLGGFLQYQFSKYQSLQLFYFRQPNYHLKSPTDISNIIGLTYSLMLPKKIKKLFHK